MRHENDINATKIGSRKRSLLASRFGVVHCSALVVLLLLLLLVAYHVNDSMRAGMRRWQALIVGVLVMRVLLHRGQLPNASQPTDLEKATTGDPTDPLHVIRHHSDLPAPLLVLKDYMNHVVSNKEAPVAIVHYACPLQAGNRLHQFLNGFLWAILTQRKIVWEYFSPEVCQQQLQNSIMFDDKICPHMNRVEECDRILPRQHWIPAYSPDDYPEPVHLNFWSTRPRGFNAYKFLDDPWQPGYEKYSGIDANNATVVVFPLMRERQTPLVHPKTRDYLLHTFAARERATLLTSLGMDFLYGMLLRATFDWGMPSYEAQAFSVGLHSRHDRVNDTGRDIGREVNCLNQLLRRRQPEQACRLYVMSDRSETVERLRRMIETQGNCTLHTSNPTEGASWLSEHGPWSGAGFFDDWKLLATKVQHGFVGTNDRSSTHLVASVIAYNRYITEWLHGSKPKRLPQCMM